MSDKNNNSVDRVTRNLKNRLEVDLEDQEVVLQNESLIAEDIVRNCPRCSSKRIVRSRVQSNDNLRVQLLPQRPYRCLHCFNRFWARVPFMADRRRPILWVIIGLVMVCLFLLLRGEPNSSDADIYVATPASVVDGDKGPSAEQKARIENVNASIYKDELLSPPEEKAEEMRKIIEASKFNVPDAARLQSKVDPIVEPIPVIIQQREATLAALSAAGPVANVPIEEQVVAPNKSENESLMRVAVSNRIEGWRKAWEAGNSDRYLNFYAANFVPRGKLSPAAWRKQRIARVTPERKINVELSEFKVDFIDDHKRCIVTFNQRYKASAYVDDSTKELVWELQDGVWNITSEKELADR